MGFAVNFFVFRIHIHPQVCAGALRRGADQLRPNARSADLQVLFLSAFFKHLQRVIKFAYERRYLTVCVCFLRLIWFP